MLCCDRGPLSFCDDLCFVALIILISNGGHQKFILSCTKILILWVCALFMYLPSEWFFWCTNVWNNYIILGWLLSLCIGLTGLVFVLAFLNQVLVLVGEIGILNLDHYGTNVAVLKVQAETL